MHYKRRRFLTAGGALAVSAFAPRARSQGPALLRKPIPSSGEQIPIVGLGTARRYADPAAADLPRLAQTLRRFAALGATVIDTAPSYGEAEQVLGRLLGELGLREKIFLATKVARGREELEASFKRLRAPRLDLVAVHNLRGTEENLALLRELKDAGRVRYVGITTSFDGQYDEFETAMRREKLDFVQVDYVLDNRGAGERLLPLAAERGMAAMINLPFGRGRLFRAVQGKRLPLWAAEFDAATWPQFFLKYIVSHPAVTCAVPGMSRPEYVEDNLGAARGRLPDAAMRRKMEIFIDAL